MQLFSTHALTFILYFYTAVFPAPYFSRQNGENPGAPVSEVPSEGLGSGTGLVLKTTLTSNNIRPKSIAHSGTGLFFAQNMMYRHSIAVYDRNFSLVKTISDQVDLSKYSLEGYRGIAQGSPVEVAFTSDGKYAWASNYKMYGEQFGNPGMDNCQISQTYDNSFVYKINTETFQIESVVEVGCVPKYVALTPDGTKVLVTNWCSGDLSIIDTGIEEEIKRIPLDAYPRGIAIDSKSRYAYISIMGEDKIAVVKLADYSVSWISDVGRTPRHLCIEPTDRYLYATLSREGSVAKIDLVKNRQVSKIFTGNAARSMTMTPDGQFLYVVNYMDNSLSKVRTEDMVLIETVATKEKPIGVTFDSVTKSVWVACYVGSILVFEDKNYYDLRDRVDPKEAGPLPPAPIAMKEYPRSLIPVEKEAVKEDPYYYIYKNHEVEDDEDFSAPSAPRGNIRTSVTEKPEDVTGSSPSHEEISKSRTVSPKPNIASNLSKLDQVNGQVSGFHVIVGSYDQRANALARVERLKNQGIQSMVLPTDDGKFRVSCFQFKTHTEAEKAQKELLKNHKIEAWILEK
ncbi:MAG: cytochrome D1 domain-containing protein [Bacteroidia bacterium]|nr:cytochrome D1 domain-containing protein [Bacteroidia bacterium]